MNIAIMGGTFNPIHYAHLLCAEQVRVGLGFNKILFVPAARPPHKSHPDMVSAEHRYEMVKTAIAGNVFFQASRIELERKGPSYTIQTIKSLQQIYKDTNKLAWIIGADSLIDYKIWRDFDEVLKQCSLIATTRPNYDLNQVPLEIRNQVITFPITGSDISGTEIRERLRKKLSIKYLVPEDVITYIQDHKLYQE